MGMEPSETVENGRNPDGTFKEGNPGGPGRPPGASLKEFARKFYSEMTEEEKIAYIKKVEEKKPGFAWQMAEGNPHQSSDMEHKGNVTVQFAEAFQKKKPEPIPPDASPTPEAGGDNR